MAPHKAAHDKAGGGMHRLLVGRLLTHSSLKQEQVREGEEGEVLYAD